MQLLRDTIQDDIAMKEKESASLKRQVEELRNEFKIKEAFFSFQWDKPDWSKKEMVPTTLKEEFSKSKEGQFIPITYKTHWDVIRTIDKANGVSYACK